MRILGLTDFSGYSVGGTPTAAIALIRGLLDAGHEVGLHIDRLYPGIEGCVHLSGDLSTAIRDFRPDVVHVLAVGIRKVPALTRELRNVRWVLTVHSISPHEKKFSYFHGNETIHYALRDLQWLPQTLLSRSILKRSPVPRLIVHSEAMRRQLQRYVGERVTTIDLAINEIPGGEWPVEPLPTAPRLATVAGFLHTKGLTDGVLAAAELRKGHPGLVYRLIGEVRDPSYLAFLRQFVARRGLDDCVEFAIGLTEDEKWSALRSSHLYLQPSHEEGFCLAFLEGAMVVPRVVGADTGAIRRICGTEPGMACVAPREPSQLAAEARRLLGEAFDARTVPARRERLSERYSISRYVQEHVRLYQELVGGTGIEPVTPAV